MAVTNAKHNLVKKLAALFVFALSVSGALRFGLPFMMDAIAVAPPNIISYQGRILNANGVPESAASLSMEFRLFDAVAGGTCVWSNSSANCDGNTPASTVARAVSLTDGLFSENLGDTSLGTPYAAIADSVFADNASLYLEVEIAGETLTPRKRIVSVGYALNAGTLDGIDSAGFLAATGDTATGDYDFTGADILGASPFTFEGATNDGTNKTTFAFVDPTAPRTVTFRDQTGTVAYLSDIGGAANLDDAYDNFGATAAIINIDAAEGQTGGLEFSVDGADDLIIDLQSTGAFIVQSGGVDFFTLDADQGVTYADATTTTGTSMTFGATALTTGTLLEVGATTAFSGELLALLASNAAATGDLLSLINDGTGDSIFVDQNGEGVAVNVDSEATTANVMVLDGSVLTTGTLLSLVGGNFTDDSGLALSIDVTETTATADILNIQTDVGAPDTDVFRVEASGETFSHIGFTAGPFSTSYYDGSVTSTQGTFNFLNSIDGNDTINIGGVTADVGNNVYIATNNATGDFILIGNDNANTDVIITGGDDWSVNGGVGSFTALDSAIGAGWSIASDGDATFVDMNSTGRIDSGAHANNVGFNVPTFAGVPAAVTGTVEGDVVWNSTGDALYVYDGAAFTQIGGGGSVNLDDAYNEFGATASVITIDAAEGQSGGLEWSMSGAHDFTVDLQGTGDFVVQDAGVDVLTITDGQSMIFESANTSSVFSITASALTTGSALEVVADALTSGTVAYFASSNAFSGRLLSLNATGVSTGEMLYIQNSNGASTARPIEILNGGTGSSIFVDQNGSTSGTINDSSGGAIHVANTGNNDGALTLYSNNGINQSSQLATFFVDNVAFDQEVLYIINEGVAPSVLIDQLGAAGAMHINALTTTADVFSISGEALTTGNVVALGSDTITSGSIIHAHADSATFTGEVLSVSVLNAASTGDALLINNSGTGSSVFITQSGDTGGTVNTTAGGALHIDNTNNEDYGFTLYSNAAGTTSPLGYVFMDGVTAADIFTIRNDSNSGTSSSLYIDHNFTTATSNGAPAIDIDTVNDGYALSIFNDTGDATGWGIGIQGCENANPTGACNYITFLDGAGGVVGAIEGNGAGGVTAASGGSDYAELFPGVAANFSQGDILALDASGSVKLAASAREMIGAVSVNPNMIGNWVNNWQELGTYVPVGLLGQIPVKVNGDGGAISVGDYITLSTVQGIGTRQNGPGYALGIALEAHAGGAGEIMVYVSPMWHAGEAIAFDGVRGTFNDSFLFSESASATASVQGKASRALTFRGSGWNGAAAQAVGMTLLADVANSADYQLSVQNTSGTEVAFINDAGDFALAGRIFPSDKGAMQTEKYIYYDSTGTPALDYMRTNAAGWGVGSYDFAEMFPTIGEAKPGDVVVFGSQPESIKRSGGEKYDARIAGIVSTRPGFLAGEFKEGHVPVALAGRVPTKVTNENGSIVPGDPLTTSSKSGTAMKATKPGPIVGYAMESFNGTEGTIIVYVNVSYYGGGPTNDAPAAQNAISGTVNVSQLNMTGAINMNGGSILSVARIMGIGERWRIEENGDLITRGRITTVIKSYQNEDVETYAVTSRQTAIQLSGSISLNNGTARIDFETIDPKFNDVISNAVPFRVFLTPNGAANSLYVTEKDNSGFTIRENGGASSVTVDWLVIADHKDYEPQTEPAVVVEEDEGLEEVEQVVEPEVEEENVEEEGEVLPEEEDEEEEQEPVIE